jgi:predicted PurR-regulated permease PerM
MNSIYSARQSQVFIWIIALITLVWLLYGLIDLFPAILGAIVMYTLFLPLHKWFVNKKGFKSILSVLIIILGSLIVIVIPFIFLSSLLANKLGAIFDQPELIDNAIEKVKALVGVKLDDESYVEKAITFLQDFFINKFSSALNVFLNLLLTFAIMYFLLYFMLKDYVIFENNVKKYIPFNIEQSVKFSAELKNTTYANIIGQGFICIVQGSLVAIGFLIFGIQDPILWGFVAFIVSFLPVVGSPMVFVPAGLISLASGDVLAGVGIILWGFILVTNIDNVLRLLIAKKFNDTHPIITILGIIIGFPMFGILGLVFGPLLISYFIILVKIIEDNALLKSTNSKNKIEANG